MSSIDETGARLRAAWREILDAEQAHGEATTAADIHVAQHAYEVALERFRHMQLEAFTVALGSVRLITERLAAHEARLAALERVVGEGQG